MSPWPMTVYKTTLNCPIKRNKSADCLALKIICGDYTSLSITTENITEVEVSDSTIVTFT